MKKNNRSLAKTFLAQAIVAILLLTFIAFTFYVFSMAIDLFLISSDIKSIEFSIWTDSTDTMYQELIAQRMAIKDSSLIGFLLVTAGINPITQILRIIILFGLMMIDLLAVNFIVSMLEIDYKLIQKRFFKLNTINAKKY